MRDARELEQLVTNPASVTRAPALLEAHAAGVRFEIGNLWHLARLVTSAGRRSTRREPLCTICTPPAYRELRW